MEGSLIDEAAENLVAHMTWVHARVPGMHARVDESLALADAGLGTDTFNTVCRARLEADDHRRIREAVEYFRERGQPFSWWVGPGDTPRQLPGMLRRAGLAPAESETAMAVELGTLAKTASLPEGLSIERVRSASQLRAFAELNAGHWSPPDQAVLAFYGHASSELLADDCPLWFYLGYVDGAPVATAEVVVSGDVAGLYNVSTHAAYRRRGIGLAMTAQPLIHARAAGSKRGVLQAAPGGVGVYERAGFRAFGEYREFKPVG